MLALRTVLEALPGATQRLLEEVGRADGDELSVSDDQPLPAIPSTYTT